MTKVHILPPDIISKIAAGEVIDRPASVVKELLENALDAGSSGIELHLEEAGRTLIHIKDTGHGIEPDDIETVFQRHSTSKIRSVDDLFNIHSLGFRGEALYSIAAVSDVTLRSRAHGQDSGWEIHMRGGGKKDLRPAPMAVGTDIQIKELFFNTPARRKFLKTNTTELNQILNLFIPYTLLYPEKRFLLTHQGKTLLDLAPSKNPLERFAATLNLDEHHIFEVRHAVPEAGIALRLVLGDINIVRARRDLQFIFVNNRPVLHKGISFHMNEVYRLILPPGRSPFFAVFADVPPGDIDVNVHPTKREVKVKDEHALVSLLRHVCEQALMSSGGPREAGAAGGQTPPDTSFVDKSLPGKKIYTSSVEELIPSEVFEKPPAFGAQPAPTEQYAFPKKEYFSMAGETLFGQKQDNLQGKLSQARFIGIFLNKFLLFGTEKSLLIIDQHAAQERITFELLIQQMEKGKMEVQHLLSPYLLKLSPQEFLIWNEMQEKLTEMGFETTQFDNETVAVHTYPALLKQPDKAVRDILAGGDAARCDHETLARRACRASIMAGDPLNQKQAEYQREQLMRCRDPFTCPHGRPTVIEVKESFLDKQFMRC